jgi:hypothetical protein
MLAAGPSFVTVVFVTDELDATITVSGAIHVLSFLVTIIRPLAENVRRVPDVRTQNELTAATRS